MSNCVIDCAEAIPARYDIETCAPVLRKFGYTGFIGFKCGIAFTDIKDPTEWATKLAADDIILSPRFGQFAVGDTNTSVIPGGCGENYPEFSETGWTFSTPSTADDYSDEDWWHAFNQNVNGYTLGYISCDGRVYLNDDVVSAFRAWTTGDLAASDPGFQISLTAIPKWAQGPNGLGKAGTWTVAGNFIHSGVFRGVEIAGLAAVLAAA